MANLTRILFFLFLSFSTFGQIKFYNLYTDNGVDMGEGIVQLEDSSYVVTGSSSSFWGGTSQAFLMKIDSLGNRIWSNQYGGANYESGRRVLYKKNVGFYICGYTSSFGNGGFDFYLAKTDESGTLEWEKTIGGTGWEKVHDAVMTKDTGAIMVGETSSFPANNKNIYIVRTDINGDTLWTKTIGGSGEDWATSITPLNDSIYFLTGAYYNEDSLMTKSWAAKIKEDGTLFWEKNFGTNGESWLNGAVVDGSLMRCIGGARVGTPNIKTISSLIDLSGNYWGGYVFPQAGDHEYVGVVNYGNGTGFYCPTLTDDAGSFPIGVDLVVNHFTIGFGFLNSLNLSHDRDDVSNQIISTNDGSAIMVGYTTGVISGGNEIFVCKIGPNADYPSVENDTQVGNLVSIVEEELDEQITIYPNPSSGVVTIFTENVQLNHISVMNLNGERILEKEFQIETQIDLSILPSGYYFLVIQGDGFTSRRKIIIQH